MITSAENRAWPDDLSFGEFYLKAGLPAPSVIRPCKIATIEARYADSLGRIEQALMVKVHAVLKRFLHQR
jgi:mRNA interferase MazF